MRRLFMLAALAGLFAPAFPFAAPAADRTVVVRGSGEVIIERAPRGRRIILEQRNGDRYIVTDRDGTVLTKSYPLAEPPRRVEKRAYVRQDQRRPFLLYGGFYGLDRWGYSREGW